MSNPLPCWLCKMQDLFPEGQDGAVTGRRSAVLRAVRVRNTQPLCYRGRAEIPLFRYAQSIYSYFLAVTLIRVPKKLKNSKNDLSKVLYSTIFRYFKLASVSPPFSSVTGDTQPSAPRLLMVTAVAQANQGTSRSAFAAVLVHLLRGSQFTSCWL